jgi:circadian clock protein KaiB
MREPKKRAPVAKHEQPYVLRLYIAGAEHNSQVARHNLRSICDEYLKGLHKIEEVDVLTDFASALKDGVFVTPTLILVAPEPRVALIGNLADRDKVVSGLRLRIGHGT